MLTEDRTPARRACKQRTAQHANCIRVGSQMLKSVRRTRRQTRDGTINTKAACSFMISCCGPREQHGGGRGGSKPRTILSLFVSQEWREPTCHQNLGRESPPRETWDKIDTGRAPQRSENPVEHDNMVHLPCMKKSPTALHPTLARA